MALQSITLNTGSKMPIVGLGTTKCGPGITKTAVAQALEAGYRHIDTAFLYENESEVGEAINEKIKEGVVERDELFITTKLAYCFQHPTHVKYAFDRSLLNLGLDYVDMYLIHWPCALKYNGPNNYYPRDDKGNCLYDESVDYVDTWHVLEEIYRSGKAKAIGVSNFNTDQIERLLKFGTVVPSVHQFECHPYLSQADMIAYCCCNNIAVIAYSPLCRGDRTDLKMLKDPRLCFVAEKYGKTSAQICLRYVTQQNISVIPRSTDVQRMKSNLKIFDFKLSNEDCLLISEMNQNRRTTVAEIFKGHKFYPFQ